MKDMPRNRIPDIFKELMDPNQPKQTNQPETTNDIERAKALLNQGREVFSTMNQPQVYEEIRSMIKDEDYEDADSESDLTALYGLQLSLLGLHFIQAFEPFKQRLHERDITVLKAIPDLLTWHMKVSTWIKAQNKLRE